ncbi:MAG: hypothetical protein R3F14_07780 [Polyangiaceae bacterium]
MIELDYPPIEVGVIETSLFAAFADGSFALYDNGPHQRLPSATATSSIRLPTRGEPRTVTFTGKSVPIAWLGTSSGEVVQVTVARKTPISDRTKQLVFQTSDAPIRAEIPRSPRGKPCRRGPVIERCPSAPSSALRAPCPPPQSCSPFRSLRVSGGPTRREQPLSPHEPPAYP